VSGVQTQPPGPAEAPPRARRARRRAFPWWGIVPVALPWLWFAVRDADGVADLVAIALPGIGFAALVASALLLGLHRFVLAATAASMAMVCFVATVGPRLPQRTAPPAHAIRVVSANVFHYSRRPDPAASVMASRGADVIVSVEMGASYWEHLSEYADRYPYAVADGEQSIRSRWPVEQLPTPEGLPSDRIMRAAIDADGVRMIVYAVHLYNPLHETTFPAQRAMLDRLIAAADAETDPVILAGDFNMSDRSDGYRELDSGMRDAMRTGWWAASTYQHDLWRALALRIDHLFVPEDWCTADAFTFRVPGSDHRGIGSTVGPCA
jgi:endonuclease/exonuclease/phosphatase (EEP) superfamily protein YafD